MAGGGGATGGGGGGGGARISESVSSLPISTSVMA